MSMGGDFYALSDNQLERMLDGALDYAKFLYDDLEEKPRECFSKAEHCWDELMKLLSDEEACGQEVTDAIPEISGFTFSGEVAAIASRLAQLTAVEIQSRHTALGLDGEWESMYSVVKSLVEFYQRAASNGDAVLFRVT